MCFKLNDRRFGLLDKDTRWMICDEVHSRQLYGLPSTDMKAARFKGQLLKLLDMSDVTESYDGVVALGFALVSETVRSCIIGNESKHDHHGWSVQWIEGAGQ